MYYPTFNEFSAHAQKGNLIPVHRELLADVETPVSAFRKIDDCSYAFLLESVEGGEHWGRYSVLGTGASMVFRVRGEQVAVERNGGRREIPHHGDPLSVLRRLFRECRLVADPELPRFCGGAVGFFAYELAKYFETLPETKKASFSDAAAVFVVPEVLVVFDNRRHTMTLIAHAELEPGCDLKERYAKAIQLIEVVAGKLQRTFTPPTGGSASESLVVRSSLEAHEYISKVQRAKKYLTQGDIIQVVLSRRFEVRQSVDAFELYRALRSINPSPYLFFLRLNGLVLVGASPEVLVRLTDRLAELRPITGTRKRGKNETEDRELADELLSDAKEKAEHVMLVDLGRNDLGKVARIGSVQVNEFMVVERYSHVMHLVSHVQAYLAEGKDAFDLIQAVFPAGTVTGAPKVRAMEIIRELEPMDRGPYAGAVGYIGFNGNMDMCISIRSLFIKDGIIYFQAGAGVVADSDPERELEEVDHKVMGVVKALELAARGLELRRPHPSTAETLSSFQEP